MHRLLFNEGTQLCAQGFLGNEIDRAAEEIFQEELHPEKALRGCRAVERDQDVDIAPRLRRIARGGAKQGKARHSEAPCKRGLVARENFQCGGAFYCDTAWRECLAPAYTGWRDPSTLALR